MSSPGNTTTDEQPQRIARDTTPRSPKRLARTAGVLYLLVAVFGGFAQGFLEPRMYVPGDAAATAGNVVANEGLVRLGVVSDLVNEVLLVLLALTLFALLNHVHLAAARVMVALALLAAGITALNVVFEFAGLQVATGAVDMSAIGVDGSDAMVLLMLDTQHHGVLIAQIFFGLWLAPLGYLAYKSGWFPRPMAVVLVVATSCYLVDVFTAFLAPDLNQLIHGFITIPCIIAEVWIAGYLLTVGVNTKKKAQAKPPVNGTFAIDEATASPAVLG